MKNFVFLFAMLFGLMGFVFAQSDGPTADYYDNGKKKFQGQYQSGKKVGEWVFYHENGKKKAEGLYINGNRSGMWITYHTNGMKKTEGEFKVKGSESVKDGVWKTYHKNQAMETKGKYRMGKRIGLWQTFNKLEQEISHKDYGR